MPPTGKREILRPDTAPKNPRASSRPNLINQHPIVQPVIPTITPINAAPINQYPIVPTSTSTTINTNDGSALSTQLFTAASNPVSNIVGGLESTALLMGGGVLVALYLIFKG